MSQFANQSGTELRQSCEVVLDTQRDKKLYVVFNPADSACHKGIIQVQVAARKFRIHLFGYAEPASICLVDFHKTDDSRNAGKELLVKHASPSDTASKCEITVFNSGARTGYVAFFSYQKSVSFEPRTFLLIPKTSMVGLGFI